MTKSQRRKTHEAINNLSHEQVSAVIKNAFPKMTKYRETKLAKKLIEQAHRIVSPRG